LNQAVTDALHRPAVQNRKASKQRKVRVHLQTIEVGRDFGDRLEVAGGLSEGDMVIANPGDAVREGLEVQPVPIVEAQK